MTRRYETYKDIPPGLIIKKDLRNRKMSQKTLAHSLGMSYSSLNKSINGRRWFNTEEATKIDVFFGYEEKFIIRLQKYTFRKQNNEYQEDKKNALQPPRIRKCVFWDIDITSLNWITHRKFILKRVTGYGNSVEIKAVRKYYASLDI